MKTFRLRRMNLLLAGVLALAVVLLFMIGRSRLTIDADITAALPQGDPVVQAAEAILDRHPALEAVYVDLALTGGGADRRVLARAADRTARALEDSGLVSVHRVSDLAAEFPRLLDETAHNLPVLFSQRELMLKVLPRLKPGRISKEVRGRLTDLFGMESVGRTGLLRADPLGLSEIALSGLSGMAPGGGGDLYRGHVFSRDGRHALVMARPSFPARDTAAGRKLAGNLEALAAELAEQGVDLAWAGAVRAALDNERIVKRDAERAVVLVTVGLAVLIILGFRRPWVGLLSIWPAACGLLTAVFFYSLFKNEIFALALGFAAALISVAVDHALAYVLMLDGGEETGGPGVSARVWSVASFAVYTTAAALLVLTLSGVPLFVQVGLFASLGVVLAAVAVHLFFPLFFQRVKPAVRRPFLPVGPLMDRLASARGRGRLVAALAAAAALSLGVNLDFSADLAAFNTLTPKTSAAEERLARVWGGFSGRTYVMARAGGMAELRNKAGRMAELMEAAGLSRGPALAGAAPGEEMRREHLAAWKDFWTPRRRRLAVRTLEAAAEDFGLTRDAFEPFYHQLRADDVSGPDLSPGLAEALGAFRDPKGGWALVAAADAGPGFDAEEFFDRAARQGFAVFDPDHFSRRLADRLNSSFLSMLGVIAAAALGLLFLLFADPVLVALTAAPLAFSLVATLGALGLAGIPLGLPSLMLAPVVIGLGLDYGIYLVRSRQKFGPPDSSEGRAFRASIFFGAVSTLIGMASLALSDHPFLRQAGTSTFLGVAFAAAGAFCFIPPVLNRIMERPALPPPSGPAGSRRHLAAAGRMYRRLEPHPRFFAWFKMRLDPMFPRLAGLAPESGFVIDLGCGYGVPAAWLLTLRPGLRFASYEPDRERARLAALVLGEAAQVAAAPAQDLDPAGPPADAVLMLDMAHYLDDEELAALLDRIHKRLKPEGRLIVRVTVVQSEPGPVFRRWETWNMRRRGRAPHFRTPDQWRDITSACGFEIELFEPTAPGREEHWFVYRPLRRT